MPHTPTASQRRAIEAPKRALLVLAGPGAGKTFCLTERIRFLVEHHGVDPARMCAFTFTNKAAGEIAHRLATELGPRVERITRGTIHAFCAALLRQRGTEVGLTQGYGIADEEYQLAVLRRIEGHRKWHKRTLNRFSAHRFRGGPLLHDDLVLFQKYEHFLAQRRVVDFDMLVLKAAELLERSAAAAEIRARWDVILVDEFQDLNPVQYRVINALAGDHRHVFGVGDDEQSIYSWAGADPSVFKTFVNDFKVASPVHLEENHRCSREVFALARKLVAINEPIFANRVAPTAGRSSEFPVRALGFTNEDEEAAWLVGDLRRDKVESGKSWGDVALLYRTHEIGNYLESSLINAGIPCRLAHGRALSDDPVIAYVLAAMRVIACPNDDVHRDAFFKRVLPPPLYHEAMAKAESSRQDLRRQLNHMLSRLPRGDASRGRIRRALVDWRNLEAVGKQHATLATLVQELLSRKVGRLYSVLEERHDEISDPASNPEVVALAARLSAARDRGTTVWIPRMDGVDIALKGMLGGLGFKNVERGVGPAPADAECVMPDDVPSLGVALGLFKAAQLIEMGADASAGGLTSFTAIDLETTGDDTGTAEIVEIAAVRVRDGVITDHLSALVKPGVPISAGAVATHGIGESEVANAPLFRDIWPQFRAFCGDDVVVAHNGYEFDFRILSRMVGKRIDLCTYDTLPLARDLYPTSRKLGDLARQFGIDIGRAHRALDDTRALAQVALKLGDVKAARARKTALVNMLDWLGVALALSDERALPAEALAFRGFTRPYALGRYSSCLEIYEREQGDDTSIPAADEVIERLGGLELMMKIRADKTADERYPAAMLRLRRLIAEIPEGPIESQLAAFLERALLSQWDGYEAAIGRVNLLTMHSTKGLEFSRVYIVGAEDAQLIGGSPTKPAKPEEIEEARRLLYVGMTRTIDRLVLTRVATRGGKPTGGHQFLDEMGLAPEAPLTASGVPATLVGAAVPS